MQFNLSEKQIEQRIDEFFERNYEILLSEGNRPITEDLRKKARNQVKMYFQKLKDIAMRITDTEVKLTLPEQTTPEGRRFAIEGVVDIVREEEETWMYDIKTHEPEAIREDLPYYAEQLNVYTYIWQILRKNALDHTAIISTSYPRSLDQALQDDNPARIAHEFETWEPVIEIPFRQSDVAEMIESFGAVVDQIESKDFAPAPIDKLESEYKNVKGTFGNKVCRFCDARFSCSSYRQYASRRYSRKFNFQYFFQDDLDDIDQESWVNDNLESSIENQV